MNEYVYKIMTTHIIAVDSIWISTKAVDYKYISNLFKQTQ